MTRFVTLIVVALMCMPARVCAESAVAERIDSTVERVERELRPVSPDTLARDSAWLAKKWVPQLIENGFKINEPGVNYPRFARFCLKVYNWGNKTFNSYDPDYVVGTGKNWKLLGKSYNWANSYGLLFPERQHVWMQSNVNADIGGYLCFMAVSMGYMFNANAFGHKAHAPRHNFNFNFTCALFTADLDYSKSEGGVKIKKFCDYNDGHAISVPFDAIDNETLTAKAYYFFNHNHYSHAAAYCFSKYQLRSAGTWIVGAATTRQEISMDFSHLPADMIHYLPIMSTDYVFRYRDINVVGGYGHNWVLKPRVWLVNLTVLPSIGYKHTYDGSTVGQRDMFSTNLSVHSSVVYNHRALFASLQGRFDGYLYFTNQLTFLNSHETLSAMVGIRF